MIKVIIHTQTRVVLRTTVDALPKISSDESIVEVAQAPPELSQPGYWKLNVDLSVSPAEAADAITAGVDEAGRNALLKIARQELVAALEKVSTDPTVANLKAFFVKLKQFWN